ncbi:CHC2 zinc finger domain-containing protein [Mucilaginibacter sabulilitoris]|uniref:CHC2 zinc finger domain-containing protein n=1 Tax=Mucilaginibacter sabulilitoris TaxID=1173583 RepID=A0ABZ0TVY6_9SPHI|nr:CHC2 zinc finger domain-containing protein [Mucilaginibacter sabulilitoris]WPU96228.1 CHC2 zinc finger domain-containing protein [Mucilaginibacter sabulilitoris]
MIPKKFIENLLLKTDLIGLAGEFTELESNGKGFKGLCPLHSERVPSFTILPNGKAWKCFNCKKGGNAVALVREIKKLSFPEAIDYLAERAGMVIQEGKN